MPPLLATASTMDSQDSQESQDSVMTVTDDNRREILYFAYGSNLSTEQMRQRCPYSTPVGLGHLKGWRWIISARGYANVVQQPETMTANPARGENSRRRTGDDEGVYGLVYLLPPQDEARLDGYEGVPWAYEKRQCEAVLVRDGDGREVEQAVKVLVYVDLQRVEEDVPKVEYVGRMERGIEDASENWGLDLGYVDRVMRRFWRK